MSTPITGVFSYNTQSVPSEIVYVWAGSLWRYTSGTTSTAINTSSVLSSTIRCFGVQANDCLYITDGTSTVKYDGSSVTEITINDASAAPIENITDLLWMQNRLWIATGDEIHSSDPLTPETITQASVRVRQGAGDSIARIIEYRDGLIMVFKSGSDGTGSVHVFDVRGNDPRTFRVDEFFQNVSVVAPRCIVRLSKSEASDVFFLTKEGFRTIQVTALASLTQPSLPLTENLKDYLVQVRWTSIDKSYAVVFDNELLWNVPLNSTNNTHTFAYSLKTPKDSVLQGWQPMDLMPSFTGVVAALGGNQNKHYIGTSEGLLQEAFGSNSEAEFLELSKAVTFDNFDYKPHQWLVLHLEGGSSGDITVEAIFEDSKKYVLGTSTLVSGGITIPFTIPFNLNASATFTERFHMEHDVDGAEIRPAKSVQIKISGTGRPRIIGYDILALPEAIRTENLTEGDISEITDYDLQSSSLTLNLI